MLARKLGTACKAQANGSKLAVARLQIDVAGSIAQKVWLLEQGAPAALQSCLDKELQAAVLTGPELDSVLIVHFN